MSQLELVQWRSLAELRAEAPAWDDLWARSDCYLPMARAELIAQWIEHFAPTARLVVMAVRQGERLLAGLPLIGGRLKGMLPVADVPGNDWSLAGDLLIDQDSDADAVLSRLVSGIADLPWPLLWLNQVALDSPAWPALVTACERSGLAVAAKRRLRIGHVKIGDDWDCYVAGLSRNHRRAMRRAADRALAAGGIELEEHRLAVDDDLEALLRRGFAVEDCGWKGQAGTSVLRSPGMFDFFLRQARQLAQWKQLRLLFLVHRGETIAFEYGPCAKGVYLPCKAGYDERFAQLAPGQLLRWRRFERFHRENDVSLVDFVGPLTEATGKWATGTHAIGRFVIAPPRLVSRMLLRGYQWLDRRFGGPALAEEPPKSEPTARPEKVSGTNGT